MIFTISLKVFIEQIGVILCFPLIFIDKRMVRWPSRLRRHTSDTYLFAIGVLVHECGRGFESHFWQSSILLSLRKNNYVWCWFSVKVCLFNQKILKSTRDIYYLCESIYWTSCSYSVFLINIRWLEAVRIAELAKAPYWRHVYNSDGCSGQRICACVRIPLL